MGPDALAQVLLPFADHRHPNLLVGLQTADDAAVYRVSDDLAIIQTIDFFPPIVDEPFAFGQIAAANAMSDIFAMGGEVAFALNVAGFPDDLPRDVIRAIFAGGAEKVLEAGGVIAGGHSITDAEPKYGLTVTGTIHPEAIMRKGSLVAGDRLILTKPLGTGTITTAARADAADTTELTAAIDSMVRLNRGVARAATAARLRAATDITGFGLLGHAREMADASGVCVRIDSAALPILSGALRYAAAGFLPGGARRNRAFFSPWVHIAGSLDPALLDLLYDPQTSGGLLLAVPPDRITAFGAALDAAGEPWWDIGDVVPAVGSGVGAAHQPQVIIQGTDAPCHEDRGSKG